MALGRRNGEEQVAWIASCDLPRSPGHPFYDKLNRLLAKADFDRYVEGLCGPYYDDTMGAPSIPPGVYFRMLLIGYFEGIDSQRGIAWRCTDSLSLRSFLGIPPTKATPDHSSLTRIRTRLPEEVHEAVFQKVLAMAQEQEMLKAKTVGVDATLLEANAAMKSIVRRDTGEDYKAYLRRLGEDAGMKDPTDEELRRFDKRRKGKKMSNDDWQSKTDPDSRVMKMKDGRTHLSYKAEHVLDLQTEMILAVGISPGDRGDPDSLLESLDAAAKNLSAVDEKLGIKDAVADNGYHSVEKLLACDQRGIRTYIPESKERRHRVWTDKPEGWRDAFHANRRRWRGRRSRKLQRLRSERLERSFAHTCETGAARRTWLRGVVNIFKRYVIHAAAHNLGLMMRKLFGVGTPRTLQGALGLGLGLVALLHHALILIRRLCGVVSGSEDDFDRADRRPSVPAAIFAPAA
jgi:transposase